MRAAILLLVASLLYVSSALGATWEMTTERDKAGAPLCALATHQGAASVVILRYKEKPSALLVFMHDGWQTLSGVPTRVTIGYDNSYESETVSEAGRPGNGIVLAMDMDEFNSFLARAFSGEYKVLHLRPNDEHERWEFSLSDLAGVAEKWQTCIAPEQPSPQPTTTINPIDKELDDLIGPDWQNTNIEPAFKAWLAHVDDATGLTKLQEITDAYNRRDALTVAHFFNDFRAEYAREAARHDQTRAERIATDDPEKANPQTLSTGEPPPDSRQGAFDNIDAPSQSGLSAAPSGLWAVTSIIFLMAFGFLILDSSKPAGAFNPLFRWGFPINRTGYFAKHICVFICFICLAGLAVMANAYVLIVPVTLAFMWCGICLNLNRFEDMGMSRKHIFGLAASGAMIGFGAGAMRNGGDPTAAAILLLILAIPNFSYVAVLQFGRTGWNRKPMETELSAMQMSETIQVPRIGMD